MVKVFLLLAGLLAPLLQAQDDDLSEAQGLPEEKPRAPVVTSFALPEGLRERSYLWLEGTERKAARGTWQKAEGPNAEASLSLSYQSQATWQGFIDGRLVHDSSPKDDRAVLEQVGVRWYPEPQLIVAAGKERSRKAPGLIVAPSDFLYTQENLPGQREQRAGLWQARAGWQASGQSIELLVLPYDSLDERGLPDPKARWNGWALRAFEQFANFDLQLSTGHLTDGWHGGLSSQGIIKAWKVYGEAGWSEHSRSFTATDEASRAGLLGVEYQGSDTWSSRLEYFQQTPHADLESITKLWQRLRLTAVEDNIPLPFTPFLRQSYLILNASGMNLGDRVNVFATLIRSLEDRGFLISTRGEWLLDNHQVLGMSLLALSEGDQQQYMMRPFDRQLSLDWKFTF